MTNPKRMFAAGLVLGALALLALAVVPASAGGLPQQGTGAVPGVDIWYVLPPGQQAEWLFQYGGSYQRALVAFGVDPANAIAVNVYTDEQWRYLGAGDTSVQPVGKGTNGTLENWDDSKDLVRRANLFWEARSSRKTAFHIQLLNTTQQPARYWLSTAGVGARDLTAVSAVTPAAQAQPSAASSAGPAQAQSVPSATAVPAPAQAQSVPSATAVPAPVATSAAGRVPPPRTLPASGGGEIALLGCAGAALTGAGLLARRVR
jgi:hypothetical protein